MSDKKELPEETPCDSNDTEQSATVEVTEQEQTEQEQTPAIEAIEEVEHIAPVKHTGLKIVLFISCIISIATACGACYLYWAQQEIISRQSISATQFTAAQNDLSRTTSRLENLSQSFAKTENRIQKQVDSIKVEQDVPMRAVTRLEKELTQARQNLSQLKADVTQLELIAGQNARDWAISEAGYLVAIAWHQLRFNHNKATAIEALSSAESRLRGLNDPELLPTRQAIQADISKLQNLKVPELTAIANRLNTLENLIFDLEVPMPRLKMPEPDQTQLNALAEQKPDGFKAAAERAWNTFKINMGQYILIHHEKPRAVPIMSEEAQQSLRQSLRVKLQTANSALVTRDTALFRQSLITIESWVDEYYDPASQNIKEVYLSIHDLKKVELQPEMPDLEASRNAILKISSPGIKPILNPASETREEKS